MVVWQIVNMHIFVYFNTIFKIDHLAELVSKDFPIKYDPGDYPGLIIYYDKFSIIIFRKGVIRLTGINKIESIFSAIEETKKILKKYNVDLSKDYIIKIRNITINGKFDYNNIDIEKMYLELEDVFYDPERFPAIFVYYRVSPKYKIPFTIFKNGSFNATGLKGDINTINKHIDYIVNSFQENIIKKFASQAKDNTPNSL